MQENIEPRIIELEVPADPQRGDTATAHRLRRILLGVRMATRLTIEHEESGPSVVK
jgi:hypothetical protein